MSIIIQNVAFRRLKDGSFTMTGTVPAGVRRSELVVFEDADERASEKFASLFRDIESVIEKHTPQPAEQPLFEGSEAQ